jgi:hypothetical protein
MRLEITRTDHIDDTRFVTVRHSNHSSADWPYFAISEDGNPLATVQVEPGHSSYSGQYALSIARKVVVCVGGAAYSIYIKPDSRIEYECINTTIDSGMMSESGTTLALATPCELFVISIPGGIRRSPRLAWDGINIETLTDSVVAGLGWHAPCDEWRPFTGNLDSWKWETDAYP